MDFLASLQSQSPAKKILVAYFSHSGNTRALSEKIKNFTGGDIFEIKPANLYPADYQTVANQAKREINANLKPELETHIDNIDAYDVIFVGSPNWWSTIAPPVATFLSSYNLSGKTIVPFITHEGSGMGRSADDIQSLCPNADVIEGRAFRGRSVKNVQFV